jgi:hypothetical protein
MRGAVSSALPDLRRVEVQEPRQDVSHLRKAGRYWRGEESCRGLLGAIGVREVMGIPYPGRSGKRLSQFWGARLGTSAIRPGSYLPPEKLTASRLLRKTILSIISPTTSSKFIVHFACLPLWPLDRLWSVEDLVALWEAL